MSPSYPATNPPYGRLHLDKESWKCWVEWEGKGIPAKLTVNADLKYATVTLEMPLLYFEVVP